MELVPWTGEDGVKERIRLTNEDTSEVRRSRSRSPYRSRRQSRKTRNGGGRGGGDGGSSTGRQEPPVAHHRRRRPSPINKELITIIKNRVVNRFEDSVRYDLLPGRGPAIWRATAIIHNADVCAESTDKVTAFRQLCLLIINSE